MSNSVTTRVELFGSFRALVDGRSLSRLPTARQQEVVAFLILHARELPVPRQRVSGSVWPESTDVQALTNLRRELHHLREGWPDLDALIDAGSRTLAWRSDSAAIVDVLAFEAAADRGFTDLGLVGDRGRQENRAALKQAARLYLGDLLPECGSDWIGADRERLRQRAQKVLTRLVQVLEEDRAYGEAIEHAQQLLRLDPLDEHAWCAIMRSHARRGERATALHLYQECAALLKKELGIQPSAATRITYREILDVDPETSSIPAPPRAAVYPLVGRQSEWQLLVNAWRTTTAGSTRVFLIRGEAGIGKTRLAEELVDWSHLNGVTSLTARCYAGEGRLAYAPIASWLKSEALRTGLAKLDSTWLTDVARLLPELLIERPEASPPDKQLESWQRLRFFEALTQAFRSASSLILVLDDLQWSDGDTIEWLQYFVRSASDSRCLVIGTVRAEEEQDNPSLVRLLVQLERTNRLTTITLGPLDRTATAQLAGEVAGHSLDEEALVLAFRQTEGHPLFIIERGRMALSTQGSSGERVLPRVQSIVAARLALISDGARAVAEVAAAVGRDFRFDILAQASDLDENALVRALDELWQRHIVRAQAEERWDFSHDRIREVAYEEIPPARRRLIHRRIADGMEQLFAGGLDDVSASIAVHFDRGGQPIRAIPFLERAAAVAMRISATEEAIRCLNYALSLINRLAVGPERDEQELGLRSSLSIALNSGRGYAAVEVEQNLERVFALSLANGRGQVPVRWLWAAFTLHFVLGDLKKMRVASEQAFARSQLDPSCRCEAHHAMGGCLLSFGELEASRHHFDAALAAYDEERPQRSALGSDLGVFAHAWGSHTHWLLGEEDAAITHSERAIALAQRLDHVYSQALAFAYAGLLHQLRLDKDGVLKHAEAAAALCDKYGFAYYGDWARVLIGWARGQERPTAGIEIIESALGRLDGHRAQARRPYYLSLLAEIYGRSENRERAASILDRAIEMALERSDLWWLPALYLQKCALQPKSDCEATFRCGLALARKQKSLGLERRFLGSSMASSF